ncbi:MAG: TolC family protein [Bacteroidota bacterium]
MNTIDYPTNDPSYPKDHSEIENTNLNFLRTKEYDVNLTATVPLSNFSVRENKSIKALEKELAQLQYEELLHREWSNFKINYFSYFKRKELLQNLYNNQKRIAAYGQQLASQKRNHKVIENRIEKVKLDQLAIELQIKEQHANLYNEQQSLLEALGKTNDENLELAALDWAAIDFSYTKSTIYQWWTQHNDRSKVVNQRSHILKKQLSLSQEAYKPTLNLQLSAGLQGENFTAEERPLYLIGTLNLKWNLINLKKNAEHQQMALIAQKNQLESQSIEQSTKHLLSEWYDKIHLAKAKLDYLNQSQTYNKSRQFELEQKNAAGKVSDYEVYNTLLEIEATQIAYTSAKFDYLIAICQLEQLIGKELLN